MVEPGTTAVGPVFVDPSGRRARWFTRTCWVLSSVMVGYTALVVVSLVAPVGILRLAVPGIGGLLPGPAAPVLTTSGGATLSPRSALAGPTPTATATARASVAAPTGNAATAVPGSLVGTPARTPSRPTPTVGPTPTPTPKPTTAATGKPTTIPSPHGSSRATAHPTPRPSKSRPPHP